MPPYSDAELRELRIIHQLACEAMARLGVPPANTKSFDELIASGDWQAAECLVQSRELVTPGWLERSSSGSGDQS